MKDRFQTGLDAFGHKGVFQKLVPGGFKLSKVGTMFLDSGEDETDQIQGRGSR